MGNICNRLITKRFSNTVLFYITIFLHNSMSVDGTLAATTHLFVTHVGPCAGVPPAILRLKELAITTQTYDSSLSGEFNITEDIDDGWSAKATMQKCQDIRNRDTCDFFSSSWVVRNGCGDDDAEELYNMLFHYVTPMLQCPVHAGYYRLDNYPFFTEDNFLTVYESKISTSVFGYNLRLEAFTVDRRNLFCIEAYLQLLYMREHNWLGGSKHTTTTTTSAPEDEEV